MYYIIFDIYRKQLNSRLTIYPVLEVVNLFTVQSDLFRWLF